MKQRSRTAAPARPVPAPQSVSPPVSPPAPWLSAAQSPQPPAAGGARPGSRRLARALLALLAAGLCASAGTAFDGAFTAASIGPVCAASAAVPGLIVATAVVLRERGGRYQRRSGRLAAATLTTCLVTWAMLLPLLAAALATAALPGSAGSPWRLLGTLPSAPKQLLTTVPPAAPTGPFLMAVGTLVWWATVWSALCAVRRPADLAGGTARRRGAAAPAGGQLLPLAAPALVLLAGTAAGVPAGSAAHLWPAALFTAFAAVLVTAQQAASRPARPGHASGLPGRAIRVLLAAVSAIVVTGLAVVLTPVLPGLAARPPADPRPLVAPPATADVLLDPLSLVSAWVSAPPKPLFTVTTSDPVNLRWLVLDSYDGVGWGSDASYQPAGFRLPGPRAVAGPATPADDGIQVTGLPGMWLPAPDRPVQVAGIAVRVDPASGVIATYDGSPAAGVDYQVASSVAVPRLADLLNAVPGAGSALGGQLYLPAGLPAIVAGYGANAMAHAASPYQEMVVLQERILADFRYSTQAPPGESYGHLALFVGGRHIGGQGVFATLFAVLARQAGFPSRLAVGFTPGQRTGPDRYTVTTADALVWPEVYFDGLGWVPFYPLPRPGSAEAAQAVRPLGEPASRSSLDKQAARPVRAAAGRGARRAPVTMPARQPGGHLAPADIATVALFLLAGLACCYLVAAALLRTAARHRRRRHPDPRQRVAGAWREVLDDLRTAGGTTLAPLTAAEVAEHGTALLGPSARPPLTRLAGLANAALFAPAAPAAADADAAWADAAALRRLARRRSSWRSRIKAVLFPWRRQFRVRAHDRPRILPIGRVFPPPGGER